MKTTKMRKITSSILAAVVAAASLAIPASSINYSSASAEDPETTEATVTTTEGSSSTESVEDMAFYKAGTGNDIIVADSTNYKRTYNIYQIFSGQRDNDNLKSIGWGGSVVFDNKDYRDTVVKALKDDTTIGEYFTDLEKNSRSKVYEADEVAEIIMNNVKTDDEIDALTVAIANALSKEENVPKRSISNSSGKDDKGLNQYIFKNMEDGYYMVTDVCRRK
jgi:hypothetical protein